MYSEQVLFLIGALFTFQVNGAEHEIWQTTQNFHDNLVGIVQSEIATSIAQIDQLTKEVSSLTTEVTDGSKQAFEELTKYRVAAINDIKNQADPSNVDYVKLCISLYGGFLETLQSAAEVSVSNCVSGLRFQFVTETEKARNDVNAKSTLTKQLSSNIEACKSVVSSDECVAHIAIEVLLHTLDVPDLIQDITAKTVQVVDFIKEEISLCLSEKVEQTSGSIDRYTGYIKSCASIA